MNAYAGRFSGRAAIVTGGASGLGKAVAARIVAEGGSAALWDLDPAALNTARIETGAVHAEALDISDAGAVDRAAKSSIAALDRKSVV